MEIFLQIVIPAISALLVALMTGLMTHFKKQANAYKLLLEEQKVENTRNTIREELEPIIEEIHRLQERIEKCEGQEKHDISAILGSYKFRLIYLCRTYLRQGYLTQEQYDELSDFYKTYHDLGGNGQAQEYYEKVMELPINANPSN